MSNKLEQLELKMEKNIGLRNMQEKLEDTIYLSKLIGSR